MPIAAAAAVPPAARTAGTPSFRVEPILTVGYGRPQRLSLEYPLTNLKQPTTQANPDKLGNSIGFWDPLSLADQEFWGLSNEVRRRVRWRGGKRRRRRL